jgi:tetratricopeptide (TPR) repeat protein
LLALCWIKFIRSGNTTPTQGEQPGPVATVFARHETRTRTRSPAEILAPLPAESATNELVSSNLYARVHNGSTPQVSREQLEPFLAQNHRSVEALLGALRASGDDTLLAEAKERFPNDPRVQFAAAFKSDSPEERAQWLEKFKQSDPDNALANYLLAAEHSKAGQTDQALQEIAAANSKRGFDNYLLDFMQNAEEAYQAGGYSPAEAKAIAATSALLPELAKLKQVGVDLAELAKRYQQAGDETSAQSALQMGLDLGHRLDQSPQVTLIQELVGMAVEKIALNAMNPDAPYGGSGQTVNEQIDALTSRRKAYRELSAQSDRILMSLSDEDVAHYYDRIRLYGDVAAMRWVVNKSSQP